MSLKTASRELEKNHESLDALFDGRIKLFQSRGGYRFSLDALLLANFIKLRERDHLADLGTGSGVIPLVLAHRHPKVTILGVELQPELAERARRNVEMNDFSDRVAICQGDVRAIRQLAKPESFDCVICNPPYRSPSSGRLSPDPERRLARHSMSGELADFVRAGAYLLRQKGRLSFIYKAERSVDLVEAMRRAGVEPKRLRLVHSAPDRAASLVLLEGVKGGRTELRVLPPLIVYAAAGEYSQEVAALIAGK